MMLMFAKQRSNAVNGRDLGDDVGNDDLPDVKKSNEKPMKRFGQKPP